MDGVDVKSIDCSTKKHPNTIAMVDDEDFEQLNRHVWGSVGVKNTVYAFRNVLLEDGRRSAIRMHVVILGRIPGKMIDHTDGNGLNNQRANLRICTNQQNSWNRKVSLGRSRFKGVSIHKQTGKWCGKICVNGKGISLGLFHDEREAALRYNDAAKRYFGEFANLNVID